MKAKEKSSEDSNVVSHREVQLKKMFKRLCDAGGFIISDYDLSYAVDQLLAGSAPSTFNNAKTVRHYFDLAVVQQKSRIRGDSASQWSEDEKRTLVVSDLSVKEAEMKKLHSQSPEDDDDDDIDESFSDTNQKFQDVFLKTLIAVMAVDGEMNQDEVDVMGDIFHSVFSKDLDTDELNQHVSNLYDWWDNLIPELKKIRNQLDEEHKVLICRAAFMIAIPSRERKLLDSIFTALGLDPSATWQKVSIEKKEAA